MSISVTSYPVSRSIQSVCRDRAVILITDQPDHLAAAGTPNKFLVLRFTDLFSGRWCIGRFQSDGQIPGDGIKKYTDAVREDHSDECVLVDGTSWDVFGFFVAHKGVGTVPVAPTVYAVSLAAYVYMFKREMSLTALRGVKPLAERLELVGSRMGWEPSMNGGLLRRCIFQIASETMTLATATAAVKISTRDVDGTEIDNAALTMPVDGRHAQIFADYSDGTINTKEGIEPFLLMMYNALVLSVAGRAYDMSTDPAMYAVVFEANVVKPIRGMTSTATGVESVPILDNKEDKKALQAAMITTRDALNDTSFVFTVSDVALSGLPMCYRTETLIGHARHIMLVDPSTPIDSLHDVFTDHDISQLGAIGIIDVAGLLSRAIRIDSDALLIEQFLLSCELSRQAFPVITVLFACGKTTINRVVAMGRSLDKLSAVKRPLVVGLAKES
jgi:hypothetical protein